MWVYIVRRLFWLPVLLAAASLVTFTLGTVGPGDPVRVMLGNKYREDVAERLRADLGLDKPFLIQYRDYMWKFVQGDFGESFRYRGQPVRDLIVPKMWVSAQLSLAAMAISLALGLPLGFFIAHRQGRWEDPATVAISLVLMSIPIMVTVPALLWGLCLKAHWIPCSGWGGIFDPRIVVPAITMGVPGVAGFIRFMRASTLDVMGQDFIRTAHSKGLSTLTVDRRHVLRNAMIPIITLLAFSLAGLIGGAFIMETIMGIPGVGRFVVESVFNRDYPVIMAVTLIGAAAFVLANLLADVTYAYIDPRIRYD
jgi:peptide/nickel transport system permease protein